MLPIFSAQEAGRSYVEARNEGLNYQDAYNNAKINGIIEGLTEAIPTAKLSKLFVNSYKKNKNVLKTMARDGLDTAITEYGFETVNGVLQELNNTAFGLQTELSQIQENKKDPLYNGPTEIDLFKSISYNSFWATIAGSGSAITAKGLFELSPELKDQLLKLDPNMARKLAREIEKGVRNADYLDQALERTTLDILNSGLDGSTSINVEDFLTDNYLAYQLGDPAEEVIEEEQILEINNALKERKTVEQVARPQDLEAAQKIFAPTTTEIDEDVSPETREANQDLLNDIEVSEMDGKINPISVQEINLQEKDAIKANIVNTRRFNVDDFSSNVFFQQDIDNYTARLRDFNEVEADNLSTSIAMMREAGMPYEIIEDISFFGMIGNDERSGRVSSTPYAVYNPAFKNIAFTKLSGISYDAEAAGKTLVGLSTYNLNTTQSLAHELGHHIDYGFDYGESAHLDSPLFEVPEYEIAAPQTLK